MLRNKTIYIGLIFLLAAMGCRANNDWAAIFIQKGKVYMKQRRFPEALIEFQKATHIDPKNANAQLNSADALIAMGNCEVALEHINQASVFNPAIDAEYYFKKAECLMRRENLSNIRPAINEGYNLAIRLDATQGLYFRQRGLAYQALGEESLALADFARARQLGERPKG